MRDKSNAPEPKSMEKAGYKEQPETDAPMEVGHKMHIEKMANGGHVIEHEAPMKMSKSGAWMERGEPKKHSFGPEEGREAAAHVMKHMGVEHEAMEEEPGEEEI